MYAEERQQEILAVLRADGRVAVSDLAQRFDVTMETIRRDLDALDHLGLVTRVHGGAIPRSTEDIEPDLPTRLATNTDAKRRIALAASRFLPSTPDASVLVDAGSTTVEIVAHLDGKGLRVLTNALAVAEAALDIETAGVELLPGHLRGRTYAAVGVDTVRALSRLHPDVAILGCNGMGPDGFTTPDPDEAAAKSAMVAGSGRRVMLADSSKIDVTQFVVFAELSDIDVLVTDRGLSDVHVHQFEEAGIEVVRA